MLFHLSRYFITEVLRVFILTTAVLTTVIAFGAAIKPLAQDDLFSAAQILKYVLAAMVPMLQYAIPVASAFAVTLVIHRMASDNEIIAAAVSGISYTRMLAPIAAFGFALVVIMTCFTHFITPKFLRLLEGMISHDITMLFQASLARDQSFHVGDVQIYADNIEIIHNPKDTDAETRMVLSRMAAVETDSAGRATTDITARQAVVDVFRMEGRTYMKLVALDVVAYDAPNGRLVESEILRPEKAFVIPNALKDSMDTKSTLEMFRVRAHPELYTPIQERMERLADALREETLAREIRKQIAERGELHFVTGPTTLIARAAAFEGGVLRGAAGAPVEVIQLENGKERYVFNCPGVRVNRSKSALLENPNLDLTLLTPQVIDIATGNRNVRADQVLTEVVLDGLAPDKLEEHTAADLLEQAKPLIEQGHANGELIAANAALVDRLGSLSSDVIGRTAQRFALSLCVVLYALAGMILSMLMRGSTPLVIYSIVFAPAILCMMLIFGGTEVMRDSQLVTGSIIMWSGHAVMLGLCVEGFRRLIRN